MASLLGLEDPDGGRLALEQLMTGVAFGAWIIIGILLFVALAIAAMLYAGNRRRKLEYLDDGP